ncbi:MAG TPA: hypothetical protein VKM54_25230 [Myxococcota bacterium]|nr:hypothetical protein [Myxococcota bacterium]
MRAVSAACLAAASLALSARSEASSPAVDYAVHCQGCHLRDGSETPGRVPALAGSLARFARVPGGRAYLVRVPGVAQSPLDDAALAALLNWVLLRFDPGGVPADFSPYSAEEVGRLRRLPLSDVAGARRRLMDEVSPAPRP